MAPPGGKKKLPTRLTKDEFEAIAPDMRAGKVDDIASRVVTREQALVVNRNHNTTLVHAAAYYAIAYFSADAPRSARGWANGARWKLRVAGARRRPRGRRTRRLASR